MTIGTQLGMVAASALLAMGSLALPGRTALAATNTAAIISNTIAAAPSCLSYRVEGLCFFLYCSWRGCRIRTSLRVSHYVPDAIVSTYNAASQHPWGDLGAVVATTLTAASSTMLATLPDSSAGGMNTAAAMASFKGADAFGNPVGMFAQMISSGGVFSVPTTLAIPDTSEISGFLSNELPNIGKQWTQVPQEIASGVGSGAVSMLSGKEALLSAVRTLMSTVDAVRRVTQIYNTIGNIQSALSSISQIVGIINGATGGQTIFCPGAASMFSLHFSSELDAYFWRGVMPLEMLYPQAWVPTLGEVGTGVTTWGSIYPRTGEIIQGHPVKASAVLAERVNSIISRSNQPHIYARLKVNGGSGYRYFKQGTDPKWQMLYPVADRSCATFGGNDSLSLSSWGDGRTSTEDGYSWNLWRKYECCRRRGSYLYSIP
ncbi:TraU family protein [Corticibacter populi]|nr:TraU family protein [Corticibacter populi]RZS35406.1 integrating conjugative element protein (TIGR03756 family) [Corticibacter populi]